MLTLADQQLIKDKLRLDILRAELADLAQATAETRAAVAAGQRARALIHQDLTRLEQRWLDAIAGETDETRIHYLLADTLHDSLQGLAGRLTGATPALDLVGQRLARGLKPRPLLTVSQWADRHRLLQSGTNAPGPWRTATTPYLRAIMDDLSEHSPARKIVFCKSAGLGATEALLNWVGYIMDHLQNKDLLLVMPTLELRDRSLNPRLTKMINESPRLAALATTATRNRSNRVDLLEYGAGARIIKSGANSPDSLRSDHLPYVICDEVDAFPWDVGGAEGEGDPMTLIENRQRTFTRAKTYLISTPTLEGKSRIDLEYRRSDMRQYLVPCPHCGERQPLEWSFLKYRTAPPPEGDPHPIPQVQEAWYVCRECGAEISEGHKPAMLAAGEWRARRKHIKGIHGYHLNALYAPLGLGLTWAQIAQKWCNAQGDSAELKAFVNTFLGEVWKEHGDSIDDLSLISRLEDYDPATLPLAFTTAGVDVQKDRLECTLVGWGAGEEAWVLDHHILPGDTTDPAVWDDLHELLLESRVRMAAIDSGYNTSLVYDFVRPRRWSRAIKGLAGLGRPLVEDQKRRRQRLRRKNRSGVQVEPLGVDQGKALLYARLKLTTPGPGFIHFPRGPACDDEYFAQLAAEKLVTRFRGQRPYQEWVQTRARNEALDCLVYALAAMRLTDVDLGRLVPPVAGSRIPTPVAGQDPAVTPGRPAGAAEEEASHDATGEGEARPAVAPPGSGTAQPASPPQTPAPPASPAPPSPPRPLLTPAPRPKPAPRRAPSPDFAPDGWGL